MFTRMKSTIAVAVMLAAPAAGVVAMSTSADAAGKYYPSCDKLHKDYKHGVAKSRSAALRQVRDGYGRPAYGHKAQNVYDRNKANLDRDKDGTACEA